MNTAELPIVKDAPLPVYKNPLQARSYKALKAACVAPVLLIAAAFLIPIIGGYGNPVGKFLGDNMLVICIIIGVVTLTLLILFSRARDKAVKAATAEAYIIVPALEERYGAVTNVYIVTTWLLGSKRTFNLQTSTGMKPIILSNNEGELTLQERLESSSS